MNIPCALCGGRGHTPKIPNFGCTNPCPMCEGRGEYAEGLRAFLCHPLGGAADRDENRLNACRWYAWLAEIGFLPRAPWIPLSMVWTEQRREEGLAINRKHLARCDLVVACGGRISPGMQLELGWAKELHIREVDLTAVGRRPPEAACSLPSR